MAETLTQQEAEQVREAVRERYAAAARQATASGSTTCCSPEATAHDGVRGTTLETTSLGLGGTDPITAGLYEAVEGAGFSEALAASLGCGNPTQLAALEQGQTVLDLGSGGGLDVLLSARRVGPTGFAYGVDMTQEMLDLARHNQREAGVVNAEFLLGTIEAVPLPDQSVDVVISNCVVNLAADKDPVLAEAFRVLRPGGRFAVSDMVVTRALPPIAQKAMALWTGCISGALLDSDYIARLERAGFAGASVEITRSFGRKDLEELAAQLTPGDLPEGTDIDALVDQLDGAVASAFVRATRPGGPVESAPCCGTSAAAASAGACCSPGAKAEAIALGESCC